MENTFKVEITYLGKVLKDDDSWGSENITKAITFKELDQTDSGQHLLHFLIASILEFKKGEGGAEDKIFIEHEKMYSLAVKAISTLMVIGNGVTEGDKTMILADSFALLNFGDWFSTKKSTPFFYQIQSKFGEIKDTDTALNSLIARDAMLYKKTMFRAFLHLTKEETDNMSIQQYMDYSVLLIHALKILHAPYQQHE